MSVFDIIDIYNENKKHEGYSGEKKKKNHREIRVFFSRLFTIRFYGVALLFIVKCTPLDQKYCDDIQVVKNTR